MNEIIVDLVVLHHARRFGPPHTIKCPEKWYRVSRQSRGVGCTTKNLKYRYARTSAPSMRDETMCHDKRRFAQSHAPRAAPRGAIRHVGSTHQALQALPRRVRAHRRAARRCAGRGGGRAHRQHRRGRRGGRSDDERRAGRHRRARRRHAAHVAVVRRGGRRFLGAGRGSGQAAGRLRHVAIQSRRQRLRYNK